MLTLFEGVPGAGKSFFLVKDRLLKAVKSGRRVYVRLEGFYLDRLSELGGYDPGQLAAQVTLLQGEDQIYHLQDIVEPGSLVVVDEAQNFFRGMTKLDPKLLRWLEAHRHYGVDVIILCQSWGQLTSAVTRLVEATYKFKRLWALGLNRFMIEIRGNPADEEVIRKAGPYRYDAATYAFYDSYAHKGTVEAPRPSSIFASPFMWLAGFAVLGIVWFFGYRPWLSSASASHSSAGAESAKKGGTPDKGVSPIVPSGGPPSPISPTVPPVSAVSSVSGQSAPVGFRVLGGGGPAGGPYLYMVADREGGFTAGELSVLWGIPILEQVSGGVPRLVGPGISYGAFAPLVSGAPVGVLWIGGERALKGGDRE